MEINKKNRSELKAYFVKNSIPTESNFADLIDAMLCQKEDGLTKAPGDPLSVEAAPVGEKKALSLYERFADAQPAWVLSLLPGATPVNPAAGRRGLGVRDGTGNTRLFVDADTGGVGIGTLEVGGASLSVAGALNAAGTIRANGGLLVPAGQTLTANGAINATGGMIITGGLVSNSGGVSVSGGQLIANGGLTVSAGQTLTANGAISANGGLTVPAGQTLTVNGAISASGVMTITGGLVSNSGGVTVSGGQLIANASAAVNGTLDIKTVARTGTHATGKSLYVTGDDGVEFRLTNGTQGIGFNSSTISATGSNPNQDLSLLAKGTGNVRIPDGLMIPGDRTTHIETDGSIYRYLGQMYITADDNLYVRNLNSTAPGFHFDTTNSRLGVGITAPKHKVDIQNAAREGTHHAGGLALYVTNTTNASAQIAEFRHTNGTQGIGFGYSTIYATGTLPHGLFIQAKGNNRVAISQENWVTPTLWNNWEAYDGGWSLPGYFMDSSGIVHLRGLVKNGNLGNILTLPDACRPERSQVFIALCSPNHPIRLDVSADGVVSVQGVTNFNNPAASPGNGWVSLDGIHFRARGALAPLS